MSRRKPIRISIPQPCHKNWDKMTPNERGRFCAHCQKTVVNFTQFSDSQLYRFLAQNKGQCCGRFLSTQLNRPINVPYQPHSRLYHLVIGLGLTLAFTQMPQHVHAQAKASIINNMASNNHDKQDTLESNSNNKSGVIRGIVTDEHHSPLWNAVVKITLNGKTVAIALTDSNGFYQLNKISFGKYDLAVNYIGYSTKTIKNIKVFPNKDIIQNVGLSAPSIMGDMIIIDYKVPLIDSFDPDKKIITSDELKHSGH